MKKMVGFGGNLMNYSVLVLLDNTMHDIRRHWYDAGVIEDGGSMGYAVFIIRVFSSGGILP